MELKNVLISEIEDVPAPESKARQVSLMAIKQVYPIILGANGDGTYQIIDGRRRVADLKALDAKTVLALVKEMDDEEATKHSLASNISRSRNHMSEAEDAAKLRDYGYTQQEIAEMMAVTQGFISQLLSLVDDLIPELQDKLRTGEIVFNCARSAVKLPVEDQKRLARMSPTVGDAQRLLSEHQSSFIDLSDLDVPDIPDDYQPPAIIPAEDVERLLNGEGIIIEWQGLTLTVSVSELITV